MRVVIVLAVLMCLTIVNFALGGDPDLVFCFSYDGAIVGDTVLDESDNGLEGVINGNVRQVDGGKRGKALEFEMHSFIDLDGANISPDIVPKEEITLCAWVKCENTGDHHVIFNARASDSTWLIHPELRSEGNFRWLLRANGGATIFDLRGGVVVWDEWLHYAGVYDGKKAILYINGESIGEQSASGDIAGDWGSGARIGCTIDDARPFTGLMDDLCMWRRALTQDEIRLVMADGPGGIFKEENPVQAVYPFFDDMEDPNSIETNWLSENWGIIMQSHSGRAAWTDSPGGYYSSSSQNSLLLLTPINLSKAKRPQMVFWQRYITEQGCCDYCYVQISTDQGRTYEDLAIYNGDHSEWHRVQLDLSAYVGLPDVRFRFLLTTDYSNSYDGWYIDDVRIDEAPEGDVVLEQPTNVSMHGAELKWSRATGDQFAGYEIYRGTSSNVGYSDTLIQSIGDVSITSYRDEYAVLEAVSYWYRVYVVNKQGLLSNGSNAVEAFYTIPKVNYPFSDDFEHGADKWEWGTPWGLTDESAHSGKMSWTDSPGGASSNNANTALTTRIDLGQANSALLKFWHRYSFEADQDYGYVEVSADQGKTWSELRKFTGLLRDWTEVRLDLSSYALQSDIHIRFRLATNASVSLSGWYIDDVSIEENPVQAVYPFFDDMEDPNSIETNWLSENWGIVTESHSGRAAWTDSPGGYYSSSSQNSLLLLTPINLSKAKRPQMVFWQRYITEGNCDYCYVQVSTDQGRTYTDLANYHGDHSEWHRVQLDLSAYFGLPNVRFRFLLTTDSSDVYDGWYVDDVRIDEAPEGEEVVLEQPTNVSMHGATLNWSPSDNSDFARYEIRRSTESSVTQSSTWVASIEDPSVNTYRDEYAIMEPDYYKYRIYVINKNDIASLGSNTVEARYSLQKVGFPFMDDLESGADNWDWDIPWELTDQFSHSGRLSWTDSPGGGYKDNTDSALTLVADLGKATNPVLRFWHRYSLEPEADYGYVEVSGDEGKTWETLLSITGAQVNWKDSAIALFDYVGQSELHIRFRIETNSSVTFDGWYIDDVSIDEGATTVLFSFDMEDEADTRSKWTTNDAWGPATPGHESNTAWTDSPDGNYDDYESSWLRLAEPLDLGSARGPSLVFWHRYETEGTVDGCYVQISTAGPDAGYTNVGTFWGSQATWSMSQINLSVYEGARAVWIRFLLQTDGSVVYDGWYIDDVQVVGFVPWISVEPGNVVMEPGSAQQFTASGLTNVTWSINDIVGGNQVVGTISSSGIYTAPAITPSPSTVTIKATDVSDRSRFAVASVTVSAIVKTNPRGDCNGDGKVDILDITFLERVIAGLETPPANANPDADGDGKVTILDITKLERIIVGLDIPPAAPSALPVMAKVSLVPIIKGAKNALLELRGEGIQYLDTVYFEVDSGGSGLRIMDISPGELLTDAKPVVGLRNGMTQANVVMNIRGLDGANGQGILARIAVESDDEIDSPCSINLFKLTLGDIYGREIPTNAKRFSAEILRVPKYTELLQNFPNPSNPETWIPYNLSEPANVIITIYDIAGHIVRELDLGFREAGTYTRKGKAAYWDGCNESGEAAGSGVYFYTIRAGRYSATRKMMVVR